MPIHKPVHPTQKRKHIHPIFNNRWKPVTDYIIAILILMLIGIPKIIWSGFFDGTIYGTVVMANGDTDPRNYEEIEITWKASNTVKKSKPAIINTNGEYRFDRDVPVGEYITLTVKYGPIENGYRREIKEYPGFLEGVKWLFGSERLGLPLSSGIPKRVDFTIPPVPTLTDDSR